MTAGIEWCIVSLQRWGTKCCWWGFIDVWSCACIWEKRRTFQLLREVSHKGKCPWTHQPALPASSTRSTSHIALTPQTSLESPAVVHPLTLSLHNSPATPSSSHTTVFLTQDNASPNCEFPTNSSPNYTWTPQTSSRTFSSPKTSWRNWSPEWRLLTGKFTALPNSRFSFSTREGWWICRVGSGRLWSRVRGRGACCSCAGPCRLGVIGWGRLPTIRWLGRCRNIHKASSIMYQGRYSRRFCSKSICKWLGCRYYHKFPTSRKQLWRNFADKSHAQWPR